MCAIKLYTYDDCKVREGNWELIRGEAVEMVNNIECQDCLVVLEEDWIKVGGFTSEVLELDDIKYPTKIDFKEVFKRFIR